MSNIYEPDYCPNCGEYPPDCDCTQEQLEAQQEAHYMRRWEESMEDYDEDQLPEWPEEGYRGEIPHPISEE